ncbi:MAG TPA: hypothetical protein VJI32_02585, partial [Candidatus Nanoarchaeia archaeon]|nr:hypothetical protein [Candidatus Nanoarchaeia archaeon]
KDLSLVADVEAITLLRLEKRTHDYSTQRLRLGLGTGQFEFGPALNLEEVGQNLYYNVGGSVKINF